MDPNSRLVALGAAGATGAAAEVLGVEDVFSTWLYTGNGSTQTITNGIDLAGEGGLTWIKKRSASDNNEVFDTERGAGYRIRTDSTAAQTAFSSTYLNAFNSDGFTVGSDGGVNASAATYVSWSFRKGGGFFDVVTFTSNGASSQQIAHNLGSVPGCIIVKNLDSSSYGWFIYHRGTDASVPEQYGLEFTTAARNNNNGYWNNTQPTSTHFTIGNIYQGNTQNYVAYLFAHDAGGFGDDGTESVIKCGSYTTDGSYNGTVTLGWEPQWVMVKNANATGGWFIHDTMRGAPVSGDSNWLYANASNAETSSSVAIRPNATGFTSFNHSGNTEMIYIAIRRGPMKTPEDATEVFLPVAQSLGSSGNLDVTSTFPVDVNWIGLRGGGQGPYSGSRLTGAEYLIISSNTAAGASTPLFNGNGTQNNVRWINAVSEDYINWLFRRAPGFFDVVAYTGTGSARTVSHNLGVAPELMIVKSRNIVEGWQVYSGPTEPNNCLELNATTQAVDRTGTSERWSSAPTSTDINLATHVSVNGSGNTYIAYLFATLAGISKIGSYTGTGTTLQVDCGFASGARFVLIKRTDSSGDWYVWDTARGIVSGNDPYLLLNSTAAEVTNTDYIDPYSAGFEISSTAPAAINASGGSFIFLAIA